MNRTLKLILLAVVVPPLFLLFIALGGFIVQLLWNWLLPPLFGWPQLGFWQALGLLALCRILFGGFGIHRMGPHHHIRRRMARRWAERWERMTPEQRQRFRERMGGRCGFDEPAGEGGSGATA